MISFERFLNPERVSMPDIDIDFDDEGRDKIIKWVVDKYGQNTGCPDYYLFSFGGNRPLKMRKSFGCSDS
jgi:DNA polymerase-3 subunit alpha